MSREASVVFISGFAAVIAQTIIIREALALFGGNELVSGILLCFWLIWGGIGSIIFTGLRLKAEPVRVYAGLLFVLFVLQFASLCFIRVAPRMFNLPVGEVIDLGRIVLITALTLAPICMLIGALFPAASKILKPERVYLLEGLGAFAGGILFSFLLVTILPPYGIMLLSGICLLLATFYFLRMSKLLWMPLLLFLIFPWIGSIEMHFRKVQMGDVNLIGLDESRYGVIAVTKSCEQYNFYTNGLYDFSYPDPYSSEEAVHYALLLHPEPENVLLVGGGIGHSITEVLKHPSIQKITYVELDPMLFKMGQKYLGENLSSNEKLTVIFGDARYYVKRSEMKYDVVIVNLPDPVNTQINRFYTRGFFREAENILTPGGLLSVRITAPPNIISPVYGELLRTAHNTLNAVFNNIVVLPAAKMTFIASNGKLASEGIVDTLSARIKRRGLDLTYVNEYYFRYDLSAEKIDYLNERIAGSKGYMNSDVKPVCYYFSSILWGGILSNSMRRLFVGLFDIPSVFFLLPLVLIFFFYRRRSIIYVSILAVGASEISAEVILIVLFQVFYGYVYGWIGAIIACYMLGLAAGTVIYLKVSGLRRESVKNLLKIEFIMGLYFATIIGVVLISPPHVNLIAAALVFTGGLLGGMHFPLSIAALERQRAGFVYGIDLVGSSVGALVTAMILIPILGIIFTLFMFALMNCLVGVGLATVRSR
jgi:spermidine synthase